MQLNNYLKSKMHFIGAFSLLFGLASCGSYQYAGQNDDSIYGSTERTVEYHEEAVEESSPTQGSSYYENYFKEKSQELDINQDDDLYFTDIDAYEGGYDVENDSLNYQGGNTGWGQDNSDVTINIFGGHLFNSIYGNRPLYPSWRWNYGYGYGNVYGYGYGYNSYWCPPYYGSIYAGWNSWNYGYPYYYGYGYGYYGNYYNRYNSYYGGRSLAYNSGRRGSLYNNSNLTGRTINRRSVANRSVTSRRTTATRSSSGSRTDLNGINNSRSRRTVQNTTTRPRTNTTRTRPRTTTTRPRTTTTRPRTTTTRTRSSNNSSVNRSRSSSNVRSSNNSSRSTSRSSSSRSSSSRKKNN